MSVQGQIGGYLQELPGPKRDDLTALHAFMVETYPEAELWFTDGRDDTGKVVSNPNVGYGRRTVTSAKGSTRDMYRVGFSATSSGISVYVLGLDDKMALRALFADDLGRAKVTGYCIAFRRLSDVDVATLHRALAYGMDNDCATSE